jgi:hypothetical protein
MKAARKENDGKNRVMIEKRGCREAFSDLSGRLKRQRQP